MNKISDEEKLHRFSAMFSEIQAAVNSGQPVQFERLCDKHKCKWNAGTRSVRAILVDKMKILVQKTVNTFEWSPNFNESKYGDMHFDELVKAIFKKAQAWESESRQQEAPPKPIYSETGEEVTIAFDPMEVIALKQVIQIAVTNCTLKPVHALLIDQIMEKLP